MLAPDLPSSTEFTATLGQVTWLATQDTTFKTLPIGEMQDRFVAPIMLKQVRVFLKGKAPVAALSWAYASETVVAKINAKQGPLLLTDWRSGPDVRIVDVISPFTDSAVFIDGFLKEVEAARHRTAST